MADSENEYPFFVYAKIKEPALPDARVEFYEDPLTSMLEEEQSGTVSGGGTLLSDLDKNGERDIVEIGIDIELADLDEALALTKKALTVLGAPTGSELIYTTKDGKEKVEQIGETELLILYIKKLDGEKELERICEALDSALSDKDAGQLRGVGTWPSGRAQIYFMGNDADIMFERVKSAAAKFSTLKETRVVFQRRDKNKLPKETLL